MNKYCLNCNKKISINAKRCKSCNTKGKRNPMFGIHNFGTNAPNYKNGKTHNNKCIDCEKKIYFKSTRCQSCANRLHEFSKETRVKISIATTKAMANPKIREKMRGERLSVIGNKNPNWQGGISNLPYPFEFNIKLKLQIRKRDNYKCQICGMIEEEHIIVYGRVLTVHHIDYDKDNCKEENLISLCNQCSSRVNYNRIYWKEYLKCKKIIS